VRLNGSIPLIGLNGWPTRDRLSFLNSAYLLHGARLILLAALSSLLLTASLAPYDYGFLAWISLVPLFFAMRRTTFRGALGLSAVFGALFGFEAFTWFRELREVSLPSYVLLVGCFSLYFLVFGLLYYRIGERNRSWLLLAAPAIWVLLEYVRGNLGFLSLPWNLIGHSQYRYLPVIQITALLGVPGLSFLIVMVNELFSQILEWFVSHWGHVTPSATQPQTAGKAHLMIPSVISLGVLTLALGYGWYVLAKSDTNGSIRVAVIQGNLLIRRGMTSREEFAHLRTYQRLTQEAAKLRPDLIVWPDSSLPGSIKANRMLSLTFRRIVIDSGAYLLTGGTGGDKLRPKKNGYSNYSNSEFLHSPDGKVVGQYNKMRLLAFNEYLPLQSHVTWPEWVTSLQESLEPGTEFTLFEMSGVRFGATICWENMFADHFRQFVKAGAQFMVSSANEGFFGVSQAPYQTLAMNVFRAVENRRAVVRTTTTGISGFISPAGEILEVIKDKQGTVLFVSGFAVRDIPLVTTRTFYTMYGDLFAYLAIGLAVLCVLVSRMPNRTLAARTWAIAGHVNTRTSLVRTGYTGEKEKADHA
jgi:apolipoprotein N-acyltransferase